MSASLGRGLDAFRRVIDAPIASFFSSCVRCGLCAEACLFYTETGEARYAPIHKLEPLRRTWWQNFTLLGRAAAAVGLAKPVSDAELAAWSDLVYDSCTLCGRCSLVCPVGNDITYMVRKMREGMSAAGHAPPGLIGAAKRSIETGSPMNVTARTFLAQVHAQSAETGIEIPVDRDGADYLVILSSMETMGFPEYLGALARIFKQANVSWTVSSEGYEATNTGIQIGTADIARQIVGRIVAAAEKLHVRFVISPECGHALTALRWEGPNLIGRPYPFKVIHVLELLDQLRQEGRLKIVSASNEPMTFHDPCQLVRRGGVIDEPRRLLELVATRFREMPEAGIPNWCCGGGGGVGANERADGLRLKVFKRKKEQVEATDVATVVTACANCRNMLEDGFEHYKMDVKVIGLTELVAEHLAEE